MLEKKSMEPQVIRKMEEIEGVRRTTGISSIKETKNIQGIRTVPDLEIRERVGSFFRNPPPADFWCFD
jgi:hypothetical protein